MGGKTQPLPCNQYCSFLQRLLSPVGCYILCKLRESQQNMQLHSPSCYNMFYA